MKKEWGGGESCLRVPNQFAELQNTKYFRLKFASLDLWPIELVVAHH